MTRQWYDWKGNIVELADDVPLTMYNGLNHSIFPPGGALGSQMITKCGKRACPATVHGMKMREVPGRGPVDCPECLEVESES